MTKGSTRELLLLRMLIGWRSSDEIWRRKCSSLSVLNNSYIRIELAIFQLLTIRIQSASPSTIFCIEFTIIYAFFPFFFLFCMHATFPFCALYEWNAKIHKNMYVHRTQQRIIIAVHTKIMKIYINRRVSTNIWINSRLTKPHIACLSSSSTSTANNNNNHSSKSAVVWTLDNRNWPKGSVNKII